MRGITFSPISGFILIERSHASMSNPTVSHLSPEARRYIRTLEDLATLAVWRASGEEVRKARDAALKAHRLMSAKDREAFKYLDWDIN